MATPGEPHGLSAFVGLVVWGWFMHSLAKSLFIAVSSLVALISPACSSSQKSCTLELRTAVRVQIESPGDLPITAVAAENTGEQACSEFTPTPDAGYVGYDCYEQGPGVYTVRVKSGVMTWTQSTSVAGDECHVTEQKALRFVLESGTAD